MTFTKSATGFVLLCDHQGVIRQTLYNDLELDVTSLKGKSIIHLTPSADLEKMLNFLVELRARNAALDWELNLQLGEKIKTFHVNGVAANDQLLIIGSNSKDGVNQLYEDIMRMNNEQLNTIRIIMKERSHTRAHLPPEQKSDLYDELSRLNNELVNLQRELTKKNAELRKLNELKNQFLGMASHDLRSPLVAITFFSQFLLAEAAERLTEEQLEFVSIIHSSSEFMLSLVNDLLDVAAIESGKLELELQFTDLAALIKHNIVLNKVLAAHKQIELVFTSEENLPDVLVDGHRIEQTLNNLISNAIKFSYPHSRIEVALRRADDQLLVSVKDEGQGIPAHERDRIFQPFSKTSVKSTAGEKSTGLGLMITRKIIREHRGEIWVDSQPGQGSTFFFSLPITKMGEG